MPRRRIYNYPDPTVVLSNIPSDDAARELIYRDKTSESKPPADGRMAIGGWQLVAISCLHAGRMVQLCIHPLSYIDGGLRQAVQRRLSSARLDASPVRQ